MDFAPHRASLPQQLFFLLEFFQGHKLLLPSKTNQGEARAPGNKGRALKEAGPDMSSHIKLCRGISQIDPCCVHICVAGETGRGKLGLTLTDFKELAHIIMGAGMSDIYRVSWQDGDLDKI